MNEVIMPILFGGLRSVWGWLQNSLSDWDMETQGWKFWKAINKFEVSQLIQTVLRTLVYAGVAYFGLGQDIVMSTGVAVGFDIVADKLADVVKKVNAGK